VKQENFVSSSFKISDPPISLQNIGRDDLNISTNLNHDILSQNQRPFQIRNDYGYAQQKEFRPQDYFVHKMNDGYKNFEELYSGAPA
jgi:hypothetical protein